MCQLHFCCCCRESQVSRKGERGREDLHFALSRPDRQWTGWRSPCLSLASRFFFALVPCFELAKLAVVFKSRCCFVQTGTSTWARRIRRCYFRLGRLRPEPCNVPARRPRPPGHTGCASSPKCTVFTWHFVTDNNTTPLSTPGLLTQLRAT